MKTNRIRLGVIGAGGRMGREIVQLALKDSAFTEITPFEHLKYPDDYLQVFDQSRNTMSSLKIIKEIEKFKSEIDVLIDFSLPASTKLIIEFSLLHRIPLVVGTTGIESLESQIQTAASEIPIFVSPNMSVGVNLCFKLASVATKALGDDYDIEIFEAHHRGKRDAPSGTALKFGNLIADALGQDTLENAVYERKGQDTARKENTIGFQSMRAGDIVGDHTIMFAGDGERIEITHRATNRAAFVVGALKAAKWLIHQDHGLYSFDDLL